MPTWMDVTIGIVAGAGVITGAVYIAFRPYLAIRMPNVWLPEQRERVDEGSVTGVMPLSPQDFGS